MARVTESKGGDLGSIFGHVCKGFVIYVFVKVV